MEIEESFPKPSNHAERIAQLETNIGAPLPADYRGFLESTNGGVPIPDGFHISDTEGDSMVHEWFGIHDEDYGNLEENVSTFRDRVPQGVLPIGRDPGGNLICIRTIGPGAGSIYFWDHEREAGEGSKPTWDNMSKLADSFSDFCEVLTE
jgi:hypothetical protein